MELQSPADVSSLPFARVLIARISEVDKDAAVWVALAGEPSGRMKARLTCLAYQRLQQVATPVGVEVLVVMTDEASELVVIDFMEPQSFAVQSQSSSPRPARVTLTAEDELELRCGVASLTLTSAGRVLLKGESVLSHAVGANRIRGGTVELN